ncbi:MAG: cell wall hydrolase [Candidatus Paceibacterota bacterium]
MKITYFIPVLFIVTLIFALVAWFEEPYKFNSLDSTSVEEKAYSAEEVERLNLYGHAIADVHMLVLLTYVEARGESELGQAMVVHNVLNRVNSDRFPNTVLEVALQQNQKRAHMPCEYDGICQLSLIKPIDRDTYNKIAGIVLKVLSGKSKNPCPDAVFYYNPEKVKNKPSWALEQTFVAQVDKHVCHSVLPWDQYLALVRKT